MKTKSTKRMREVRRWSTRQMSSAGRDTLLRPVKNACPRLTPDSIIREESPSAVGTPKPWLCYLLLSGQRRTYVGATNDIARRFRQHLGLLAGGARYTSTRGPWRVGAFAIIGDKIEALRFEWRAKRARGQHGRRLWLQELARANGARFCDVEGVRQALRARISQSPRL